MISTKQLEGIKKSIENTRQDLLEAINFSNDKNYKNSVCKISSAVFNNTKTLNLLNKVEGKG